MIREQKPKFNKKQIIFNHFGFEIIKVYSKGLIELESESSGNIISMDETTDALFDNGSRSENFLLVFRENWTVEMVAHECYHAFFHLLDNMSGDKKVEYEDLAKEVYAYRFSDLFAEVIKTLEKL